MNEKPKKKTDVHTEHCCAIHGCKYGEDDDGCTVTMRFKLQSYSCDVLQCIGYEDEFIPDWTDNFTKTIRQ